MIDKTVVGKRIAALRKELSYSQSEFADRLNVTTQAVSKWETGLTLPDIEVLLNIAWIGKVSVHTLLEGDDLIGLLNAADRGLAHISKHLVCPQCREPLTLSLSKKQEVLNCSCKTGHRYDFSDGVIHFGSREIEGELWSLWLRNYEHYLEEQHHPGNPRYWTGNPHYKEVMWQNIERLRPRTILDIACGTGNGIKYMIERINWPTTIIMTDLSHRILKWNKIFYADEWKNPYVDMVYLACDCANLPLADNSVDMIFSNCGFESMQSKIMDGFSEGFRVLKNGGHGVYNISAVDDHQSENTQKWVKLCPPVGNTALHDINQWIEICKDTGYAKNEAIKIYSELPAPIDNVFPFENEILQWMAEYVVVSQK